MDTQHQLIEGEKACQFSYSYQSLMGSGQTHVIEKSTDKRAALNQIMLHQTGQSYDFDDAIVDRTLVFSVTVDDYSAKVYR